MSVTNTPATRFPSGTSNSAPNFVFRNYPQHTPMRLNEYFNDFNTYNAGDFTVTAGSTGAVAQADGNGGLITITTAATNNDIEAIQLVKKGFAFTAGSQVWFSCNLKLANASNNALMVGLGNDFSALGPTDGVYFSKAAASAVLTGVIRQASTSTTLTLNTGTSTMVAATYYSLSFYYNGQDKLYFYTTVGVTAPASGSNYFSGGNQIAGYASSEAGATYSLANLPAVGTNLTAGIALKAGTTVAQVATVDYLLASEEIVARF